MELQKIQIFHYSLPFVQPLVWHSKQHFFREGLLIRVEDAASNLGYGEIAPLPGFSQETLQECQVQLVTFSEIALRQRLPLSVVYCQDFERKFSHLKLAPAVRFGLQMALLNLLACHHKTPPHLLINCHIPKNLAVTLLLSGRPHQILKKAEKIAPWPALKSVKLKVGRLPVEEEIALVKTLRHLMPTVQIRLDANRAWDLETALHFGTQVADCDILYIEEPTQDPKDGLAFTQKTGMGMALDESLHNGNLPEYFHPGIQALVVKPTLLGGIEATLRLAEKARPYQIPLVVSSSYESGVGLNMLANLAVGLSGNEPAGLDTHEAFQTDLLQPRFSLEQGQIPLEKLHPQAATIQKKRLKIFWQSPS